MKVFQHLSVGVKTGNYNPMKPLMIGNNSPKMLPKIPSIFVIMAFPYSSRGLT